MLYRWTTPPTTELHQNNWLNFGERKGVSGREGEKGRGREQKWKEWDPIQFGEKLTPEKYQLFTDT